jgi:hypothetical protein
MAIPFEVLMEYAASLTEEDLKEPLGQLAARAGTFPERLADAMTAVNVVRRQNPDLSPVDIRAVMHPAVRKAVEADRGGVASGGLDQLFGRPQLFGELG